jgi:CHAD domain-containing protein/adenylate cyclase class IV
VSVDVGPPPDQEVEFKLLAQGRLVPAEVEEVARSLGLDVGPVQNVRQIDRYLDTASFDLLRRGGALRVRGGAGAAKLCFKGSAVLEGEALRRLEIEEPLAAGAPDPVQAIELPRRIRDYVEPVVLLRPLLEIARLENHRVRHTLLHLLSGAQAELCIDRVRVLSSHGVIGTFVEVEIEAKRGGSEAFASLATALVERLGLAYARPTKLERALLAAGRTPPRLQARRPELRAEMPFREAAARVFRVGFEALRAAEPLARLGEDDEGVHRMRVATRRLRAAFRIFAPAFGPTRLSTAKRLFGQTGRALGPVRDLDVMLSRMPALSLDLPEPLAGELAPLFDLLVELREDQRRRMLAWLTSRSRLRAMERFESLLARLERRYAIGAERDAAPRRARRRGAGDQPTGEVALELLHAAARRVFKRGDKVAKHSPPETLHELRIAVKRLRYTADALEGVAPKELILWLKQTVEIQDLLGTYNDARVMEARLTGWIETRAGRRLPRKAVLAVGGLLGVQERRARDARKEFRRQWRGFSRERWRRRLVPPKDDTPPAEG